MKKIIIGSTAIKHWYPDFNREPKDLDYAVDCPQARSEEKGMEYLYNPILFYSGEYLNPSALLTLKVSHLFWETNFDKHMWDVQFLLGKGLEWDLELMNKLMTFWDNYLPQVKRSKLNSSKEDFFTNAINKDEDEHDSLHEKLAEFPAYKKILKPNCEVEVCEEKWNNLTEQEKRDVIEEETYVMQHERYNGKLHHIPAYRRQLRDNIIKHFPKFVALYAIKNFKTFINPPQAFEGKLD